MSEGYSDAYEDLGGHATQIDEGQEDALYKMGLGSREMRKRVELKNRAAEDAKQHLINKAGAEAIRQGDIERDRANGVDVTSRDYLVKQLIAERNRARRY